jgi:serine/threonine protein kinase
MEAAARGDEALAGPVEAAAGPTWDLPPGHPLGPDRKVLRQLAIGRKTEVYLAWDERRRSTVVAKLLRPHRLDAKLEKLRREADLLQRLNHPVLVRGLDAALEADPPHLVLEHVEGESLRRVMRREGLSSGFVAAVGLQVATALHYLAGEGLVHLDVKPHNILLGPPTYAHSVEPGWDGDGYATRTPGIGAATAKLVDIAGIKPVGALSRGLGGQVPELRVRRTPIGAAAAVWLLGATMWVALPGGYKGRGLGLPADDGAPSPPDPSVLSSDIPPEFVALLLACLADEPADRPAAGDVAAALERLVLTLPVPTRWSPERPRRRWLGRLRRPRLTPSPT